MIAITVPATTIATTTAHVTAPTIHLANRPLLGGDLVAVPCTYNIDSLQALMSKTFLQRVSIALAMQSAVLAMIDSVCLTV